MTPKQRRLKRRRDNQALSAASGNGPRSVRRAKVGLPPLKKLKVQLKALISEYVIKRDSKLQGGFCLTCLKYPIYAAGHIIPSSDSLNTRYDPDNLYGVCLHCNYAEVNRRSHWAAVVFPKIFGYDKVMELHRRATIRVKFSRVDYMNMIADTRRLLESV